jgi:hypothetical protein
LVLADYYTNQTETSAATHNKQQRLHRTNPEELLNKHQQLHQAAATASYRKRGEFFVTVATLHEMTCSHVNKKVKKQK